MSRACRAVGISRAGFRYIPKRLEQDEKRKAAVVETATRLKRWGLPRPHDRLRKEGHVINPKITARIYRELGLQVRKRRRKKLARLPRIVRPAPSKPNDTWSMDFVHDWLMLGRKLKCLTTVDDLTKQSVGILVAGSISGADVAAFLARLPVLPTRIRSDNGPEFQSNALRVWIEGAGIEHDFITPGKPNENAFIESFKSRLWDECRNEHVFRKLEDAKR